MESNRSSRGDRCKICHGFEDEHGPSIKHVFTLREGGDLRVTPAAAPKLPEEQRRIVSPDMPASGNTTTLGRIIMVLQDKGILNEEDILKIVGLMPMGTKAPKQ